MGNAVLSGATVQTLVDNIAQIMVDSFATQPSSTTTVSTDLAAETARINALTDTLVQGALGNAWSTEQRTGGTWGTQLPNGILLAYLNAQTYQTLINKGPYFVIDALEWLSTQTSANRADLLAFLVANSILVDQYFADVFNAFQALVKSGNWIRRYGTSVPSAIPATQVFTHANVDSLNLFTLTGASAGTLTAGTASLAAIAAGGSAPGGGVLEAYAGNAIGASGYTITVTYTSLAGVAGQTMTFTITANATSNTVFTPSGTNNVASIQSVAITTGTGTTGDIIKFRLKPVRAIAA